MGVEGAAGMTVEEAAGMPDGRMGKGWDVGGIKAKRKPGRLHGATPGSFCAPAGAGIFIWRRRRPTSGRMYRAGRVAVRRPWG